MKLTTEALARPQPRTTDLVVRQGWREPLFFVGGIFLFGAALISLPWWIQIFAVPAEDAWFSISLLAIGNFSMGHIYYGRLRAAIRPNAWVAVIGSSGVTLNFRSYLHGHWPQEDRVVLQLEKADIAYIAAQNPKRKFWQSFKEGPSLLIALHEPLAQHICQTLLREEIRSGRGDFGFKQRNAHEPVKISNDGRMLKVALSNTYGKTVPAISEVLGKMSVWYKISALPQDFSFKSLQPALTTQDIADIRALVEKGKKIDALLLLRRFKKTNLKETKAMIESGNYE